MASNPQNKAADPADLRALANAKAVRTALTNAFGCFDSCAALLLLLPHLLLRVMCVWFFLQEERLCACARRLYVRVRSPRPFALGRPVRKASFTAPVKLARGSPQDVRTPDLPAVNRRNSVSAEFALRLFLWRESDSEPVPLERVSF